MQVTQSTLSSLSPIVRSTTSVFKHRHCLIIRSSRRTSTYSLVAVDLLAPSVVVNGSVLITMRFRNGLCQSDLLRNPPADVVNLVACYDRTLQTLIGNNAPFVDIKPCAHVNAPWYDRHCQQAKAATHRLEQVYRRDKTDANRETWKRQSKSLHSTLRQTYVNYCMVDYDRSQHA